MNQTRSPSRSNISKSDQRFTTGPHRLRCWATVDAQEGSLRTRNAFGHATPGTICVEQAKLLKYNQKQEEREKEEQLLQKDFGGVLLDSSVVTSVSHCFSFQ